MTPDDIAPDDPMAQPLRQAVALRDAPAAWVHAAVALWPAHSTGFGLAAAVRRVLAALSFDSQMATPGMLATRSGRPARLGRHLLFSAEGRDIDLRVLPAHHTDGTAGGFALAGQVLGPDDSGEVQLWTTTDEPTLAGHGALNALGEFRIDAMAAGSYHLLLRLGDEEVLLPPLDLDGGRGD